MIKKSDDKPSPEEVRESCAVASKVIDLLNDNNADPSTAINAMIWSLCSICVEGDFFFPHVIAQLSYVHARMIQLRDSSTSEEREVSAEEFLNKLPQEQMTKQ